MTWHRWSRVAACAVVGMLSATAPAASAPATTDHRPGLAEVALSPCASSDNGWPDLQSVSLSPRALDVRRRAAWLTVTATVTDDGGPGPATGVRAVDGALTGRLGLGLLVELVHQDDGTWQGRVGVPPGTKSGTHSVQYVPRARRVGLREPSGTTRLRTCVRWVSPSTSTSCLAGTTGGRS